MALSDEVFAKLDSLIMSENNPPAAIDSSADKPVDTTNVDTTGIDPIKSLHSQFYAGKDSIAKVFKNSRVELNKSLDSLNNRIAGFNKIKDAGFNVDAPLKEQEKAKSEALKALEYLNHSQNMATTMLEAKLFGMRPLNPGERASQFVETKDMSAKEITELANTMGVDPKLLRQTLSSLKPMKKPSKMKSVAGTADWMLTPTFDPKSPQK